MTKAQRLLNRFEETIKYQNGKVVPTLITFDKFKRIINRGKFEGMVALGAGGSRNEWILGISKILKDRSIVSSGNLEDLWYGFYVLTTTGGRTDLAFVFNEKKDAFNIGKLSIWRLMFEDVSWISDYLVNYADQH